MENVSLEAHMYIDPLYWQLEQIAKDDGTPKDPMSWAIDDATGYSLDRDRKRQKLVIEIMTEIVKQKKRFGLDAGDTEQALANIKAIPFV